MMDGSWKVVPSQFVLVKLLHIPGLILHISISQTAQHHGDPQKSCNIGIEVPAAYSSRNKSLFVCF